MKEWEKHLERAGEKLNSANLLFEATYKLIEYPKEREKMEVGDYVADITKIKGVLDWKPKTRERLIKTVKYYEKNKPNYW